MARRTSIADIKARHKECGGHFFDRDTMRFFGSRVVSSPYAVDEDTFVFVTHESKHGLGYKLRLATKGGCDIETIEMPRKPVDVQDAREMARNFVRFKVRVP